jgi:hypothetical protein
MLPYLATIVVLVLICRNPQTILLNKPMSLGISFRARVNLKVPGSGASSEPGSF